MTFPQKIAEISCLECLTNNTTCGNICLANGKRTFVALTIMGYRSTVGQLILDQSIEVRILVPQPHETASLTSTPFSLATDGIFPILEYIFDHLSFTKYLKYIMLSNIVEV